MVLVETVVAVMGVMVAVMTTVIIMCIVAV